MGNFFNKKTFVKIISIFILGIVFLLPNTALALDTPIPPSNPPTSSLNLENVVTQPSPSGGQVQSAAQAKTSDDSEKNSGDNWLSLLIKGGLNGIISNIVLQLTLLPQTLSALLMGLSGAFLEWIINYTVIGMSSMIGQMRAIDVAWAAFRDMANLFFIFILLYIAIGTILNLGGINTKKMLVNVVITAILLNFSLFFTKIMIDASNLLAVSLYNSTVGSNSGLGMVFLSKMKILDIYSLAKLAGSSPTHLAITQMGTAVFMFIAAGVFFAVSLLFIIRFVVLIFLMVLSPLAFASMALPKDKYSGQWWDTLISQCIFAPLFMALIWVTVKISAEVVAVPPNTSWGALLNPDATSFIDAMPLLFNFIILIAMLIFSLVVAKSFASKGAGSMMKMAAWAQGKVGRTVVRRTGIAQLDRKFADSQFGKSVIGRPLRAMTTGFATNYDFGDKQSVQKVDKAEKKLNEDYGKKVREDFDKNWLEEDRKAELNKLGSKDVHEKTQKDSTEAQKKAEEKLKAESASGKAFEEATLKEEKVRLENMRNDFHPTSESARVQKDRDIKDLEEKIRNSETIHTEISTHKKSVSEATDKLGKIAKINRRMEDKAGAETPEEKEGLRTALRARANDMDSGGKGISGIFSGTGKGIYKRVFKNLDVPLITPYIKDLVSSGSNEEAVKALRKNNTKINLKKLKADIEAGGGSVEDGADEAGGADAGGGGGEKENKK